jgi:hypothetical protein
VTTPRWVPPAVIDRAFTLLFLVLAATAWAALTLAELGAFTNRRLWLLAAPVVLAGTWIVWRDRAQPIPDSSRVPRLHLLIAAAALLASAVVTGRPTDYLINGSDASVYLNIASAIERRGGITVEEPLLSHLDDESREALFARDPVEPRLQNFFPGGIHIAADGRRLQPSFFHLLPAAIAGFSALTGSPSGGLLVLPFAGLIAMAAVWLLAVRLSSPVAATAAVWLLTANFAHLWFARFPSSEGLTAALLTSGLWFTVRAARDRSTAAGLFGGAAFGLAAAARLEILVLVTPLLIAYLVVLAVRGRWTRADAAFAAGFSILTAQAVVHAFVVTTPYTHRILLSVFATDWFFGRTTLLLPAVAVVAAASLWLVRRVARMRATPVVRTLLALVLLAAVVREWSQLVAGPASLLFTPVGLLAMTCGAVWLVLDDPEPHVLLIVVLFIAAALVYVDAPRAGRWYPITWRRYVPVVLPIGILLVGHLVSMLSRRGALGRIAAVFLMAVLISHSASQSRVFATATPMAGLRDEIARLAAAVPTRTVLVTDETLPSHLGLSLHFTFEQPVLTIRHGPGTAAALDELFTSLAGAGWSLAVVVSPQAALHSLTRTDFAEFDLVPLKTMPFQWTELEFSREVPTRMRTPAVTLELYAVHTRQPAPLPLVIDIGPGDLGWRGDGFHGPELIGGATVRWSSGAARVLLPPIATVENVRLTIRMAAPRPPGRPPARATLNFGDGLTIESPELTGDLREVVFDLDRPVADRLAAGATILTLGTTPFVPRAEGQGDDSRQLGLVVDSLRFEAR